MAWLDLIEIVGLSPRQFCRNENKTGSVEWLPPLDQNQLIARGQADLY